MSWVKTQDYLKGETSLICHPLTWSSLGILGQLWICSQYSEVELITLRLGDTIWAILRVGSDALLLAANDLQLELLLCCCPSSLCEKFLPFPLSTTHPLVCGLDLVICTALLTRLCPEMTFHMPTRGRQRTRVGLRTMGWLFGSVGHNNMTTDINT